MTSAPPELRERLPRKALDCLDCNDTYHSEWATACGIAMSALNAGLTEGEFVAFVSVSDFARVFATEDHGRDRSNRLESRLRKAWSKVEAAQNPLPVDTGEVRQQLVELLHRVRTGSWPGRSANTDRAVAAALVSMALDAGGKARFVHASTRQLSLISGVGSMTVSRSLLRLRATGLIESVQLRGLMHSRKWTLALGWLPSAISHSGTDVFLRGKYHLYQYDQQRRMSVSSVKGHSGSRLRVSGTG